ncbi:hypothetical protein EBU71_19250 [bacterium]|jgi:hypothetical protein|nr:hypothetical protein [Candidatus Elulimicrobium humile]
MSVKETKKQLNEVRLSWSGKLLFATIAARLAAAGLRKLSASMSEQTEEGEEKVEPTIPFNISGTPEQIAAMTAVINASIEYQKELKRDGATVESVMDKLNAQNQAKVDFKNKTGYDWPL